MKNKIYKYTVMSRGWRNRTIIHKRTNWKFIAKLWAWWIATPQYETLVVHGHVETQCKDNQP